MSSIILEGGFVNAPENILIHQVTTKRFHESKISSQLAQRYPGIMFSYENLCRKHSPDYLLGICSFSEIGEDRYVAHMFTQVPLLFRGRRTHLGALRMALNVLKTFAVSQNLTLAMPDRLGISKQSEWNAASMILNQVFGKYPIAIYDELDDLIKVAE